MPRPMRIWGGLLMDATGGQRRYVVVAPTKTLAIDLLKVQSAGMNLAYFNGHWSESGNHRELALLDKGPGVWVHDEPRLYGKHDAPMKQTVTPRDLEEARKRWAEEAASVAERQARFKMQLDAESRAHHRVQDAHTALEAAALNMVTEFPKGGAAREDAYIALVESAQELDRAETAVRERAWLPD